MLSAVINGLMLEIGDHELAAQLAVDSPQHVQVERGRYANRIVVSHEQLIHRLDQVGTQKQRIARRQPVTHLLEKFLCFLTVEISNCAAEKKNQHSLPALAPRDHRT